MELKSRGSAIHMPHRPEGSIHSTKRWVERGLVDAGHRRSMSAIFPPAVPRTNAATTPNAAQEPPKQMFRNSTAGPLLLRRAQEVGTLIRVGRDTYIEPHDAELPQWDRVRAEVLARCATLQRRSGDSFVVSHMTAALIHGLWVPTSTTVHVTQPHSRTSTPWSFDPVVRHRRELRPEEVTMVGGIRVTSLVANGHRLHHGAAARLGPRRSGQRLACDRPPRAQQARGGS